MKKYYYVYHSIGTSHDDSDDVAIVEAENIESAIEQLKKYYVDVNENNVQKIDLYRKGFVQGIHIVSDY